MSEEVANKVATRISVIDSLISKRQSDISDLIQKGLALQNKISSVDPSYKSEIVNQITEFEKLRLKVLIYDSYDLLVVCLFIRLKVSLRPKVLI